MSGDGELMLTILSAFAQEESRSASDNQKWRIRKAFENGELMNLRTMFGYRISREDGIEIDPEQAEVVREMYARIIRGDTLTSIARWLNRNGHRGAFGGKWTTSRLRDALSNEKYMGHSLLQKKFRVDHIDKTLIHNKGELPQYYVTETHPAIIDEATFEAAQQALERIAAQKPASKPREHHIFTGMIICSACGRPYRHVKNHGKSRWACPTYIIEGKAFCESKQIPEEIASHFGFDGLIHVRLLLCPCGRYCCVKRLSGKSKAGALEKNASASGRHKPAVQGIVPKHNPPRRAAVAGHGSSATPGCCGLPSQRSG